jgi:hypothetical protein
LAAAAARQNQGLAAETKVAAATAEDARLQREMVAGLQLKITQLTADGVQLREQLTAERRKFRQQKARLETEAAAATEAAGQRPPVSENKEPPVGESETTKVVGLRAEVVQLKAQQAEDRRKLAAMDAERRKLVADAEAAQEELRVELAADNSRWQQHQLRAEREDMKAAEAKLAAVDAERGKSEELAGDISLELAAADRKSGRLEKQIIKLEKQLARLKEEKTELKKQVVADGKIVVSEKIHKRQQAELASHRKSKKHNTVREQNAEALVPFKDDLEKIKEMMHDVEVMY